MKDIATSILLAVTILVVIFAGGIYIWNNAASTFADKPLGMSTTTSSEPFNILGSQTEHKYLAGTTATTTVNFSIPKDASQLDINLWLEASGTEVLEMQTYFGSSTNCASSTLEIASTTMPMFMETTLGVTSGLVTITASTTYEYTSLGNYGQGLNLTWNNMAQKCMRLVIWTDQSGDETPSSTGLWIQGITK